MFFSDTPVPSTYHLIDSPKKLAWLAKELASAPEICFDIETNHPTWKGKHRLPEGFNHIICGISFAWGRKEVTNPWRPGLAAYIPLSRADDTPYWRDKQDAVVQVIRDILESDTPKVAHNGKFDVYHLALLLDIKTRRLEFDTMLAHALIDEERLVSSHALKSDISKDGKTVIKKGIADVYLMVEPDNARISDHRSTHLFKSGLETALDFYDPHLRRYSKVPLEKLYPYACADTDLTLSLEYVLGPMLREEGLLTVFDTVVMPLQHVLTVMELHGVPLDIERALAVRDEQARILKESEQEIHRLSGVTFNVASTQQLGKVLFEDSPNQKGMGLKGTRNERGAWETGIDALKALNHEIAKPLMAFRRAEQIKGLYAEAALEKIQERTNEGRIGWVHGTYWMDSVTGRLKLQDPNLLNLPRPENGGRIVKGMYAADADHCFVFSDFSQIELRVIAHISREPVWIEGFNRGDDMHCAMAKRVWNLPCEVAEVKKLFPAFRSKAKIVNFSIAYGKTEQGLAEDLGVSVEEAHKLIHEEYFGAAPVLKQWIDYTHAFLKDKGYVMNIFGRRRHLPDAMLKVPTRMEGREVREGLPWPSRDAIPSCYRNGPYPLLLKIDPTDIYAVTEAQIAEQIKLVGETKLHKCTGCPYLRSCFVNREVKYTKSKVNAAMRQGVNAPIQGSAVDMASLALCWIYEDLQREHVDACPILHIHDELVIYAKNSEVERVRKIMNYNMTTRLKEYTNFLVPIEVDMVVASRWSDRYEKEE